MAFQADSAVRRDHLGLQEAAATTIGTFAALTAVLAFLVFWIRVQASGESDRRAGAASKSLRTCNAGCPTDITGVLSEWRTLSRKSLAAEGGTAASPALTSLYAPISFQPRRESLALEAALYGAAPPAAASPGTPTRPREHSSAGAAGHVATVRQVRGSVFPSGSAPRVPHRTTFMRHSTDLREPAGSAGSSSPSTPDVPSPSPSVSGPVANAVASSSGASSRLLSPSLFWSVGSSRSSASSTASRRGGGDKAAGGGGGESLGAELARVYRTASQRDVEMAALMLTQFNYDHRRLQYEEHRASRQ